MIESIPQQWKKLKLFDKAVIAFFFILNVLISIFYFNVDNWFLSFLMHFAVILAVLYLIPLLDLKKNRFFHFLRYWYLVFTLIFIYWNVGNFIHLIFPGHFDYFIISLEESIFGVMPNIWIQKYVNPVLTEVMQLSYAVYWFVIPVGAGILYFNHRYRECEYMLFFTFGTFFLSYLFFIFIPVAGPRFMMADQIYVEYKGLFLTGLFRGLVEGSGLKGGAYPSSHVAVAVVILFFVWKYYPKIGKWGFLPAVIALSLSTVYGQYHYITDMISGLAMGIIIGIMGLKYTSRALSKQHEIPAILENKIQI
jgi:membrane-associated phospholipid phosphatase